MLIIYLDIPDSFRNRVHYALDVVSVLMGVQIKVSRCSDAANIVYSKDPDQREEKGQVHIPFCSQCYANGVPFQTHKDNSNTVVWGERDVDFSDVDLIGSIYRLLTLQDEAFVTDDRRDSKGLFEIDALPLQRQASRGELLVENAVAVIERRLVESNVHLGTRIEKWPGKKKYAICLTHDVDSAHIGAPAEILSNTAKYFLRRSHDHLTLARLGLKNFGYRHLMANPLMSFLDWHNLYKDFGFGQAFYIFYRPPQVKRHLNDCKSSLASPHMDWNGVKRLIDDGHEVGLHPSIFVADKVDHFVSSKQWLESKIETPVIGVRHHYWRVDWRNPHLTFRKQMNSGFRYDCSISWQEVAGFRAGTSHPYRPYDSGWDKPLNIYELPTSIMDGHVTDFQDSLANAKELVDKVARAGGVCVLDWHSESFFNKAIYKGDLEKLDKILAEHLANSECWAATPAQVVAHWHRRSQELGVVYE